MGLFKNTIINFHKIENKEWLESVFVEIKKRYKLVPIHEIEEFYYNEKQLTNVCHVTFDDGELSFYTTVFPLLKKYEIPVSLYVSPYVAQTGNNFWFQEIRDYNHNELRKIVLNLIDKDKVDIFNAIPLKYIFKNLPADMIYESIRIYQKETGTPKKSPVNMNIDKIIEVYNSGLVEIGAHTQTHPILKNESDEKSKEEIKYSIHQLAEILGKDVRYFAYPNGIPEYDFGKREINTLEVHGVRLAFSTETDGISLKYHPLSVPRNGLTYGNKYFMLSKLIMGKRWPIMKKLFGKDKYTEYRKIINNDTLVSQ